MKTYCALDSGSTDCWINEQILHNFSVKPTDTKLTISTMMGKNESNTKIINNIKLTDIDGNNKVTLPVTFTRPNRQWPFTKNDVVQPKDVEPYNYLHNVPFNFVDSSIGILIGNNVPEIMRPLEVIGGPVNQPFASRHSLGWAFNGPINQTGRKVISNRTFTRGSYFDEMIENYVSREFDDFANEKAPSIEDQKWLTKVKNSTVKLASKHFQIDLPIKDNANFPCNKIQIRTKFQGILKRLRRDEHLLNEYTEFMQNMLSNNFAERIPANEIDMEKGHYWYLNHHPVYHKQKHKLRVVFNCSLEYKGVSLNSNLLQGPDLANSLFGVLTRFRLHPVAFVADIAKMFYQVKVPPHHANFMRFFWLDETGSVAEYRLLVHVFGATSSPSVANYALQQSANASGCDERTKTAIEKGFYVDDFLKSEATPDEAISMLKKVDNVLRESHFHLTGYNSNSMDVLASVPESDLATGVKIYELPSDDTTRTLGVLWNTCKDKFTFCINNNEIPELTKRNILKCIASVYDPIGLISPVIVIGKKIFQETCARNLSWDDCLPSDLSNSWKKWNQDLLNLRNFEVKRCIRSKHDVKLTELHVFCDGSEKAYGATAYVKFVYADDSVSTALLASKSRLTPLNNSTLKTVPRIELASGKLAVELSCKLKNEIDYEFSNETFWSDSTTVLNYIKNESKRFHRYVANKVNYIRNFTSPDDWKYVESQRNPADLISRGMTARKLQDCNFWKFGPLFLRNEEDKPEQNYETSINDCDKELKREVFTLTCKTNEDSFTDSLLKSRSSWYALKTRVAAVLMIKEFLVSHRQVETKITLKKLQEAEKEIIKFLQRKYYDHEIKCIEQKVNLPKTSSLRKLQPFLDDDNVLRVGGRLKHSNATYDVKHPIIVPPSFQAELLIKDIHASVGHLGRETTIAKLRSKFWIVKVNSMTRKILKNCLTCRKIQGKPGKQEMADLPALRLDADNPPFTNTGVDFFGPFQVSHGRKREKRYGVVFSCLTTRAIHVEIAYSLTTDSFINALRRFLARRGCIKTMSSDNGTNLVGGENELKRAINDWNRSAIETWATQQNIDWHFNPPHASHFGGAWEREIRTIRKTFNSLLLDQNLRLDDESLHTLMCEVECILNSRPLTPISNDDTSTDALTPNHLLLHTNFVTLPPGLFKKSDHYSQRRWRQVQYLTNQFWTKWKKQYMALLIERQKWYSKEDNFEVNDLVLVVDLNLPRNQWPLGRIIAVHSGPDNLVRICDILVSKCKNNVLSNFAKTKIVRPVTKLIKLRHLN